ncbi:DNA-binding of Mlu1-box binding protein MBP1 [Venustampulla echinocandica]|uniref:DNA-binding of Mlu1-box binding protein MBP1 n=1 Tax=Venustampulla echinocandica TaxID=2656787 RepID=A0A370TQR9_9HELO|nr:DNA-binding of Mlu1-box binding protein MBP1 [Venustampulla echinocandica]RDL37862.1 DNA-binding of Mlu1-box binding protein MBP1 [Venustampulla echinocandica]
MNHGQQDMYYSSHISAGQPPPPQTVTSGGMSHYPQHQQPPLLQPGPAQYSTAPGPYNQYGYSNGLTSPPAAGHPVPGSMGQGNNVLPLPAMSAAQPGMPGQGYGAQQGFDTTGQVAPPGMKPRVTATLWEDEGSLCFQVEAKGVCVARREDNHMINGTKLLNVAGMTRGRRDGILKSEKLRHVVKIGPMHLKGVWIPFERALDFANKEKITELLYPLFVHNIGALLYHPTNQTRTNAVMAAAERRKQEQNQLRNSQAPGLPSLHQHHHHSMNSSIGNQLPGPQHSLAPHPSNVGRPGMDRAHTFPTPPTSASSVMGNMGSSDGNFQWGSQGGMSGQGANPLSIDTGLSNARSMPTTPATTPPGTSIQSMQQYQQSAQPYDASRPVYSAPPPQQPAYPQPTNGQQNMSRYPQSNPYIKNEMGPPLARAPGSESEHHESKDSNGMLHNQLQGQVGHVQGEEEAEHEHDAEYTHDNSSNYDATRASYNYANGPAVGSLPGEHAHLSPEMTGSPNNPASGRATPRTAAAPQPYYAQQQGGYSTPPRVPQPPSSNLYNVMSSERGTANGNSSGDVYGSQSDLGNPIPNGYAAQQPVMNGAPTSNKRGRDDDDDARPSSRGPGGDVDGLKRRKTIREGSVSGPTYDAGLNRARSAVTQRRR